MSVRRSIVILLVFTVALPLIAFGVRANQARTVEANAPQVQTYTVARAEVELIVSAIGTMQPEQMAALRFIIPGRITGIPVRVGQFVRAGEELIQQDDDLYRIGLEQAMLALETAEAQQADLLDGVDPGQITIAQANIDAALSAASAVQNAVSSADVQTAQLSFQQALDALTAAQTARATAPGEQPQSYYDLLEAQIGEAGFNAEIARLNLERLQTGSPAAVNAAYARVEQARAELDRLLAGPTQAEIDRAAVAVDRVLIDVDQAQAVWDRTRLTAPFDGIVTSVNTEVGAIAAPGVPVVEVTDMSRFHLNVQVDEIDVRQVRQGMSARVVLDALPDIELPAVVDSIALIATNQAGVISYDVKVLVDNLDPRVRVGMTAEAAIVIEAQTDVLTVPNQYIRLDRARTAAFVNVLAADGTLQEISVTLGLQGQDVSEIIDGLRAGDVVAIDLSGDDIGIFGG